MSKKSSPSVRIAATIAFASALITSPAVAQLLPLCNRARPVPSCRTWVVTEVGAEFPLLMSGTDRHYPGANGGDFDAHAVIGAGLMTNLPVGAIGIVGAAMTTGAKSGGRGELRFRRPAGERAAFQASLGLAKWAVPGVTSNRAQPASGLTTSIGIDGGWIRGDARLDLLEASDRRVGALSIGGALGEKPARVMWVATVVAGLLLVFSALTGFGYSEAT